jgi:preprotein translocase subunit YajC
MTSRKKLVKQAIKNFALYTAAEIAYFKLWLENRKRMKQQRKQQKQKGDTIDG